MPRKKTSKSQGPANFNYEDIVRDVTRMQMATQQIPAIVAQEMSKSWKQLPNTDPKRSPKSWFFDPLSLQYSLGYKDRRFNLTYDTLKRVAAQLSIVSGIINVRAAQIAAFSEPYRKTRSLGFLIKHKDPDHATTPSEIAFIKELESFVANCGRAERNPYSRIARDDFETFLKKIVRDSLVFDQCTFEVIPDRLGLPFEFVAMDASTIRIASDDRYVGINSSYSEREGFVPSVPARFAGLYEGRQYGTRTADGDPIDFVQVVNGQIENVYSGRELAFGIRNPRTDIYIQGYGYGELEQLITIVTAHLHAEEYNRKFFCMKSDTYVHTREGMRAVIDLVGKDFEVWTGTSWEKARGYATGPKPLHRTKLWNGIEIGTSSEHLFRVIPRESQTGEPEWRRQCELKAGDCVLIGYQRIDCPIDYDALLVDKYYETDRSSSWDWKAKKSVVNDPEFWEMIGFALGDGYWPTPGRRNAAWMGIFPHHTKDAALFDRFLNVCKRHGINAEQRQINKHHTRVTDGEKGYPAIMINHKAFIQWLHDLGFASSSEPRRMPRFLFAQPAWMREAVLRGLFSADGHRHAHITGYATPTVHSSDSGFQSDIVSCLWSVGVAANLVGSGWARKGEIDVQDIAAFTERIRYLQDYKNEDTNRCDASRDRWDQLHPVVSRELALQFRQASSWCTLSVADRDLVCKAARSVCQLSRPRARTLCNKLGIEIGEALQYAHVSVDVTDVDAIAIEQMYDIEVFDDRHLFLANHMAVHNTQGSAPKGILNFKGDNWTPEQLEGFKRHWFAQVSGVENSWKTPILQSEGLDWIDLNKSNAEMEFGRWIEYLIKITCGVFLIDPAELNFDLHGGVQQTPLFESSQEWKLKASRDRGLKPLLKFIAKMINKYIIDPIDSHFTLEFVGLDEPSEQEKHENRIERVSSYQTLNEIRREMDLPDLPGGDVPMNPTYIQALQLQGQMAEGDVSGQQLPGGKKESKASPNYSESFNMPDLSETT